MRSQVTSVSDINLPSVHGLKLVTSSSCTPCQISYKGISKEFPKRFEILRLCKILRNGKEITILEMHHLIECKEKDVSTVPNPLKGWYLNSVSFK